MMFISDFLKARLEEARTPEGLDPQRIEKTFVRQLKKSIDFTLTTSARTPPPFYRAATNQLVIIEFPADLSDEIIHQGQWQGDVERATLGSRMFIATHWTNSVAFQERVDHIHAALESAPDELRQFLKQFTNRSDPSDPRIFQFSIRELLQIIRADQVVSGKRVLSLVLPGGGVKAAYQSRIVDHLYKEALLTNSIILPEADPHRSGSLAVSHIVGTSGGALLGAFVAAANLSQTNLTSLLWKKQNGEYLDNFDVFPRIDLMRWLSFLISSLVFGVVIALAPKLRLLHHRNPSLDMDERSRAGASLRWCGLLTLCPFCIKFINGYHGAEHVSELAGGFYFVCLCIGLCADQSILVRNNVAETKASRGWWILLAVGWLMILHPIAWRVLNPPGKSDEKVFGLLGFEIPRMSLLACLGFLLLALLIAKDQLKRHKLLSVKKFVASLGLLLLVPALAYLVLIILFMMNVVTLFELNLCFWGWLLGISFGVSVAILAAGRKLPRLQGLLAHLQQFHPATGPFQVHVPRYVRLLFFAGVGWLGWNLIIAPALYGNATARQYVDSRFTNSAAQQVNGKSVYNPSTYYTASASNLKRNEAKLFVFPPENGLDETELKDKLGIKREDPRWRIFGKNTSIETAKRPIFASGSPFPIFPAHYMRYSGTNGSNWFPEWLVDGGFAHNVPIQGALLLGASQVLVVNSSPNDIVSESDTNELKPHLNFMGGPLTQNLKRVFPFLFQHSQIADAQSAHELLVGVISPSESPEGWPSLVDFRRSVVDRLVKSAEGDLNNNRRIGAIESWGKPVFRRRLPSE